MLYSFGKEEEVKRYIKGQAKKSFVFGFDSKFCPSIICASSSGNGAG